MHKDATPHHLTKLAEWAGRNTPPSYQWFKEFGKTAADDIFVSYHDIQSGDCYSLRVGKKEYSLTSIEEKFDDVAMDILSIHCKKFDTHRTVACKTRQGLNIQSEWYVEQTITLYNAYGFPAVLFCGAACSNDRVSAAASSLAIALCRTLAHIVESKTKTEQRAA